MNDKELIEEIAERINSMRERNAYYYVRENGELVTHEAFADSYAIAAELAKYYQPKLPEGSVVLTKEEHEQLSVEYKRWEKLAIEDLLTQERKQAVKEVIERLKAKFSRQEERFANNNHIFENKIPNLKYESDIPIVQSLADKASGQATMAEKAQYYIDETAKEFGVDL